MIQQLNAIAQEAFNGGAVEQSERNYDPRQLFNAGPGMSPVKRRGLALLSQLQIAEAAKMWASFLNGEIDPFLMMEAVRGPKDWTFPKLQSLAPSIFQEDMTRSDFTNLTTFVIDRILYSNYQSFPKTYDVVCKVNPNVIDFRAVERWQKDGGELPYQKVGELATFNKEKFKTGRYTYQVFKYEKGAGMSWEAVINDDMGTFTEVPQGLSLGAIRTIEQFWLSLIASATGPNSSFYGTAISLVNGGTLKNIIDLSSLTTGTFTGTNNPVLNVINVILSAGLFMNQMTYEGRPINAATDELVIAVGDGILYQTLMNIINTNQIATTILGGTKASSSVTADMTLMAQNWISGRIRPVYLPELRNIVTSNLSTSWWMFAKPGLGRPAIELGFLKGYSEPQLYRKMANTVRVSGGTVEEHGDFETMSTELKGLIVFGGTRMDPRMTMASNGTGS